MAKVYEAMQQVVWTIAGFDPSSGAGITADLATFAAHGLFGCSAIAALTVQSTLGVAVVEATRPDLLEQTLEHLAEDLPPAGIKIGMLATAENAAVLGRFLERIRAGKEAAQLPVVLDPVLRSSSGHDLFPSGALAMLRDRVLPFVDVITPNWSELAMLSGDPVTSLDEAAAAARHLARIYPVLIVIATGGDQEPPTDVLVSDAGVRWDMAGQWIETRATHGTGCAFSSSVLANLVLGATVTEAARAAKVYVAEAMRRAPGLGHGKGPLGLLWTLERRGELR